MKLPRRALASFRGRLLLLLVALVAVTQIATLGAVLAATRSNVDRQLRHELQLGARVFRQLLDARTDQLLDSVEILTADFGFREAVATGDRETIRSVLENHGARGGADLVILVDLAGQVVAETATASRSAGAEQTPELLRGLLRRAETDGQAAAAGIHGGVPYQLIVVPVLAPVPVAWIAMGFAIDDALAQRFEKLTHLDVSFAGGAARRLLASTLPEGERAAIAASIAAIESSAEPYLLASTGQLSLDLRLDEQLGPPLHALLQTSFAAALAPWRAVRGQILTLGALALALATLAAFRFGRGLARPVQSLVEAAARVRGGRYGTPVALRSDDEFGLLAATFNEMQQEIAEREQRIVYQAHHDLLTGLPNRSSVRERLAAVLEQAAARRARLALVALDLDEFRSLNDSFGHATGDQVLIELATRLRTRCGRAELVARLGGDEFLIVLEIDDGDGTATAQAALAALSEPFATEDALRVEVAMNAGVVEFPEHGVAPDLLLRRVDIALQDAKRESAPLRAYRTGRDERHLHQLALARDLRAATAAGDFRVHYQPKVELLTREVAGVEALVRWSHPVHGPIRPDEFIPLAERLGLIGEIGRFVMTEVLRQWRAWSDRGIHLGVAVNVSALDLDAERLPAQVRELLEAFRVPPSALTLEITESVVMENPAEALRALEELRRAGVGLAIDDFGTGHSSLAQLKRLPVHELKIDKGFVLGLKADSEDAAIVRSIVDLGHRLGRKVVAEGVEDAATWELLLASRCDLAQGFFLTRPLPADELESWLREFQEAE